MDIGGHRAPSPVKLMPILNLQKDDLLFLHHSSSVGDVTAHDSLHQPSPAKNGFVRTPTTHPSCVCSDQLIDNPSNVSVPVLIYYQNSRGLRSKITDFNLRVSESLFDCVVLSETWLDPQINSSQLFGDDYTVFRVDRNPANSNKRCGGGVAIAVRRHLSSALLTSAMDDSLEQLWVTVSGLNAKLAIGVIYIPPNLRNEIEVFKRHLSSIEKTIELLGPNDDLSRWSIVDGKRKR